MSYLISAISNLSFRAAFDQYSEFWHRVRFFLSSTFSEGALKYDIWWLILETYLEPSRTSTMKRFLKIVSIYQPLTILPKKPHRKYSRSKYASEYYNKFFSWRFQIKVDDFLNFFSTINFSYQYPPEAKAYLEPSGTSGMELFRDFFFVGKFTRNYLS